MTEDQERAALERQLEEMWGLVDELGDLSVRLRRAADAAITALGLPQEEEK